MTIETTTTKPIKRLYAVSKRDQADTRKADWIEIGAEWATSNPSITRFTQNDAFVSLLATGNFDLVSKAVEQS